jgi:saccharopine dehydrogenase-like NADP-dependent oxidoreductase
VKSGRVGQRNAWQCADRHDSFGITAIVHTPKRCKDFNDILKEMRV